MAPATWRGGRQHWTRSPHSSAWRSQRWVLGSAGLAAWWMHLPLNNQGTHPQLIVTAYPHFVQVIPPHLAPDVLALSAAQLGAAPPADLADSFSPVTASEGSAAGLPAMGAAIVQPPAMQAAGAVATTGEEAAASAGESGCMMPHAAGAAATTCHDPPAAREPATAADGCGLQLPSSRAGSAAASPVPDAAAAAAVAADVAHEQQGERVQQSTRASLASGRASRAAAVQLPADTGSPDGSGSTGGRSSASSARHLRLASMQGSVEQAAGEATPACFEAELAAAAAAAGTSIPPPPVLGGPANLPSDFSSPQPSAALASVPAAPKRSPIAQVPSPAALYAAMQTGKVAGKSAPAKAVAVAGGAAHMQLAAASSAATRTAGPDAAWPGASSSSAPAAGQQAAAAGAAVEPASTNAALHAGMGADVPAHAAAEAPIQDGSETRPKTGGQHMPGHDVSAPCRPRCCSATVAQRPSCMVFFALLPLASSRRRSAAGGGQPAAQASVAQNQWPAVRPVANAGG